MEVKEFSISMHKAEQAATWTYVCMYFVYQLTVCVYVQYRYACMYVCMCTLGHWSNMVCNKADRVCWKKPFEDAASVPTQTYKHTLYYA